MGAFCRFWFKIGYWGLFGLGIEFAICDRTMFWFSPLAASLRSIAAARLSMRPCTLSSIDVSLFKQAAHWPFSSIIMVSSLHIGIFRSSVTDLGGFTIRSDFNQPFAPDMHTANFCDSDSPNLLHLRLIPVTKSAYFSLGPCD